jgi:hypothetical protein
LPPIRAKTGIAHVFYSTPFLTLNQAERAIYYDMRQHFPLERRLARG